MKKNTKAALYALGVIILGLLIAKVVFAGHSEDHKITICHATASQTNPYVTETVDKSSILDDGHGHSGVNEGDIIPPFDDYPGNNWDAEHQAIFNNDCSVPELVPPVIPPVTQDLPPTSDNPPETGNTPPTQNNPPGGYPTTPTPPDVTGGSLPSGGGGGNCYGNCTPIVPITPSVTSQNTYINSGQPSCIPITNFVVSTGVPHDGRVHLSWNDGSENKFVFYGTSPTVLDHVIETTANEIELTGLPAVNHWFIVSNNCSSTDMIDPLP